MLTTRFSASVLPLAQLVEVEMLESIHLTFYVDAYLARKAAKTSNARDHLLAVHEENLLNIWNELPRMERSELLVGAKNIRTAEIAHLTELAIAQLAPRPLHSSDALHKWYALAK